LAFLDFRAASFANRSSSNRFCSTVDRPALIPVVLDGKETIPVIST
jgi:hypothetical protein